MPTKLTAGIIAAATEGFESQKHRIDDQIAELRAMLSGGPAETGTTPEVKPPNRRKMGAAARRRMALAQKARWAKIRGEAGQASPTKPEAPKPKRQLSAAGRAAIIAATKKMWAAKRAEAARAKSAGAKMATPARKIIAVKKAATKKTAKAGAVEAVSQ